MTTTERDIGVRSLARRAAAALLLDDAADPDGRLVACVGYVDLDEDEWPIFGDEIGRIASEILHINQPVEGTQP